MRIKTRNLLPGDIMITGEEVISTSRIEPGKVLVKLKKRGKFRLTTWNYYGTISVRSINGVTNNGRS